MLKGFKDRAETRCEWRLLAPGGVAIDVRMPTAAIGDPPVMGRFARGDLIDVEKPEPIRRSRRPDPDGHITALRMARRFPMPPLPVECGGFDLAIEDLEPVAVGFPLISLLTSGVTAGVAAVFFSPIFAILAGVSALGLVGRWLGSIVGRRRARKRRERTRRHAEAIWRSRVLVWLEAETVRRRETANGPTRLLQASAGDRSPWSDRLEPDEALGLTIGRGDVDAPIECTDTRLPELLGEPATATMHDVPITIAVADGLAVCGDRSDMLACSRWLVASTVADIGPADLGVIVVTTADRCVDWDWLKWVPSLETCIVVGVDSDGALLETASRDVPVLVVVDGGEPLAPGPLARVMAGRIRAVRLLWLGAGEDVPGGCRDRLEVAPGGGARFVRAGHDASRLEWHGLELDEAEHVARWLAPFVDPEVDDVGGRLPLNVSIGEICDVDAAHAAWRRATPGALVAPIGIDADGVHVIDLVADGPHCLAAGTTGAGKSELLRTLVVGLAAGQPPDLVTFVLIDFKGGGAFDAVAELPHVAAVVTDLDSAEASRALRGLRAELLDREHRLRDMECSDIADTDRRHPRAFGRLVVMIDEFAALADELPDFLDGLVDVARRGRSLGVHLVLATQRPSGVVAGQIRANTNLRICLRVQDRADSADVIDRPDAALLPLVPGRAVVQRGGGASEVVQVAQIGRTSSTASVERFVVHQAIPASESERAAIDVIERWRSNRLGEVDDRSTDTTVAQIVRAARASGYGRSSPPWRQRLQAVAFPLDRGDGSPMTEQEVAIGLLDDPDRRRVVPLSWDPGRDGLLIVGVDEAEIAASAAVAVAALLDRCDSAPLPTFVFDGRRDGADSVRHLLELDPVIDVVGVAEPDRLAKAVDLLSAVERPFALVVHDWQSVVDALSDQGGPSASDRLVRLVRRCVSGAGAVVVTARSDRDVPQRVAAHLGCRVVHRLGDPAGYMAFGLRLADIPALGGAACVDPATGLSGMIGRLDEAGSTSLAGRLARWPTESADAPESWPRPIRVLGSRIDRAELPAAKRSPEGWRVPIGLDLDLAPHWVDVSVARPVVVLAHAGRGRTTTLQTIAQSIDDEVCVIDDADLLTDDDLLARIDGARERGIPLSIAGSSAVARRFGSPIAGLLSTATVIVLNAARSDGEALRVSMPELTDQPRGRAAVLDRGRVTVVQVAVVQVAA